MLQAVMTAPGEIIFEEVPTPEPEDDDVLVHMMRIGVCGSDIHVYHGKHPFTSYSVVQGHEASGRVASFDAFTHAFDSYIHQNASTHTYLCALDVMRLVVEYLPRAIKDGFDNEARANLAWADTLAGSCITNAGTVLPHGIGMAIGGHAFHIRHGEALAVIYPEFMRYTYSSNTEKFATVARLLDAKLDGKPDEFAAEASCDTMDGFLQNIGMYFTLKDLDVPEDELPAIADDSVKLPDYPVNPRVPDRDAIFGMLTTAYDR